MKLAAILALLFIHAPAAYGTGATGEPTSDGSVLLEKLRNAKGGPDASLNEQATYESIVGDYRAAEQSYRTIQAGVRKFVIAALPSDAKAVPVTMLADVASGKRIVAFNEAHILARTRTVTLQMLPLLREKGFTYLALEALDPTPDDLNERGFPFETSGTYTEEPVFAELVRTAIELGFKVVPYEASSAQGLAPAKREQAQFENLLKILDADPTSKMVIHAGYAHIFRAGGIGGAPTMMERLVKKISPESVLVIDQTEMIEGIPSTQSVYERAVAMAPGNNPFLVQASDGKFYASQADRFDISVVFPPEQIASDRPSWLDLNGLRSPRPVSSGVCEHAFPCLVEAHYSVELEHSVAADRYLFAAPSQDVFLYTRRRPVSFTVTTNSGTRMIETPKTSTYELPF